MIEIPEGIVLASQLNDTVKGKTIKDVIANHSPHKFAWFHGDPDRYKEQLVGKKVGQAISFGGKLEIKVEDRKLAYVEGINLRYLEKGTKLPKKHQFLIQFEDGSYLVASVQMYGGMWVFEEGKFDNEFYNLARVKPSPIADEFTKEYFTSLIEDGAIKSKSIKAFLATEQRIPGLGNGVLQDILYNAKIHPKRKVNTLSSDEKGNLYRAIKSTLLEMIENGGRDTEKDLYGNVGGYKTKLSKFTVGKPCPFCGETIEKKSYMGGSIYYCIGCQL